MIELVKDPATFLTEEQLVEKINATLGEGTVVWRNAGHYVFMDKYSPDMELAPGLRLKQFMSANRYDTLSYVRVRLLADVINIVDVFGKPVEIIKAFKSKTCRKHETRYEEEWHREGNAVDIRPLKKSQFKDLCRAVRYVKRKGGKGYYPSYIHLDCGYNKTWEVGKRKKAD